MDIKDKISEVEEKINEINLATTICRKFKKTIKIQRILIATLLMVLLITNAYWICQFLK